MHHCLNKTDICIFLTYQESQGQWLRWDVGSTTSLGTQALSDSLCFPGVALLLLYIQCCCSLLIWKNGFQIWLHTSHSFAVVVQSVSHVWLFVIPWTAARQASLSFTISQICSCPSSRWCHPTVLSSRELKKKKVPVLVLHPKLI